MHTNSVAPGLQNGMSQGILPKDIVSVSFHRKNCCLNFGVHISVDVCTFKSPEMVCFHFELLTWWQVNVCIYMQACVYICVSGGSQLDTHVYRDQTSSLRGLSLVSGTLANKPQGSIYPHFPNIWIALPCPDFYLCSGVLKFRVPFTCVASTWSARPPPQPQLNIIKYEPSCVFLRHFPPRSRCCACLEFILALLLHHALV